MNGLKRSLHCYVCCLLSAFYTWGETTCFAEWLAHPVLLLQILSVRLLLIRSTPSTNKLWIESRFCDGSGGSRSIMSHMLLFGTRSIRRHQSLRHGWWGWKLQQSCRATKKTLCMQHVTTEYSGTRANQQFSFGVWQWLFKCVEIINCRMIAFGY
jgi:hypothetical protein